MNAIQFICNFLGYQMQNNNNYNMDSYVMYGAIMLIFVLMILMVYFLVRFFQWIWGAIK